MKSRHKAKGQAQLILIDELPKRRVITTCKVSNFQRQYLLMTPIPRSLLRGYLSRTVNYLSVEYPVACGGDLLLRRSPMSNVVLYQLRALVGFVLGCCFVLTPHVVESATTNSATLSWDPNSEANLAGYHVYQGTTSGSYGLAVDAGNTTIYTAQNLQAGLTYYWATTAYDSSGNESPPSNEVSLLISALPTDTTPPSTSTLSVSIIGSGMVNSSPTGIRCPSHSCSASYGAGSTVTLTAKPDKRWKFTGWSGACSGTGECVMQLSDDQIVEATFSQGRGRGGGPKK